MKAAHMQFRKKICWYISNDLEAYILQNGIFHDMEPLENGGSGKNFAEDGRKVWFQVGDCAMGGQFANMLKGVNMHK